jgi:hypothetical protein
MEISRNLVYPTMLQKAKRVTGFLVEMSEKAGPLNAMAYTISRGVGARKKGGSPKMQGYPTICMKIKGKKILSGISDDVYENRRLNCDIRRY